MPQLKKIILSFMGFFLITSSFANEVCNKMGTFTLSCGKGTLYEMQAAGKVILNGTTVLDTIEIAGILNANEANLHKLIVFGQASLHHSIIKDETYINGILSAKHVNFYKKLTVSAYKTYLSNAHSRDIEISRKGGTQIVCIGANSVVDGNILFASNHGVVIIDKSSKINGRVFGAYINPNANDFQKYCGKMTNQTE